VTLKPQNIFNSSKYSSDKLPVLDGFEQNQFLSKFSETSQTTPYKVVGLTFLIASALTSFVATVLLTLIWKYLNDLPSVKESVLVHLYKDICALSVIAEWTWLITVVSCFLNEDGTTVGESLAKIISFSFAIIELKILLTFNLISALRLAMIKQCVVDPEMPWGDDEGHAIRRIQCGSILCVAIFASVMYLCGGQPQAFYYLIGDTRSLLDLPKATLAFTIALISLSALPIMTAPISLYVASGEKSSMDKLRGFTANYLMMMTTTIIGIALVYGVARNHLDVGRHLIVGQGLIFVGCVSAPLILILTRNPLRSYVSKTITNLTGRLGNVRFVIMSIGDIFHRRSRQIHDVGA
jgi:hypothetical protein